MNCNASCQIVNFILVAHKIKVIRLGESLRGSELLHFSVGKHILLVAKKEEKMLPANVVKRELDERIESLEQKENRKLKKTEKQTLKMMW